MGSLEPFQNTQKTLKSSLQYAVALDLVIAQENLGFEKTYSSYFNKKDKLYLMMWKNDEGIYYRTTSHGVMLIQ